MRERLEGLTPDSSVSDESRRRLWPRLVVLGLLAGGVALLAWRYGPLFSLESLAAREGDFLSFGRRHTVLIAGGLFLLYVGVTASSFPAATALTLLTAWLFRHLFGPVAGFVGAVVLVSFASTAGATLAFLLSRHLLRDAVRRRYGERAAKFDEALRRDGPFYLFTLRLTPVVPFWLVNLVMGLTPIRTRTFWWVSQVGMLPGTFVFVLAGHQVPTLAELEQRGVWEILWPGPVVALLALAVFPWICGRLWRGDSRSARMSDMFQDELLAFVRPIGWRNPAPRGRYNLVVVGGGDGGAGDARRGRRGWGRGSRSSSAS